MKNALFIKFILKAFYSIVMDKYSTKVNLRMENMEEKVNLKIIEWMFNEWEFIFFKGILYDCS